MNIFIHDFQVFVIPNDTKEDFQDSIVFWYPTLDFINAFLMQVVEHKVRGVNKVYFIVDDEDKAKKEIKSQFKVLEAAGGIVKKDAEYLMIFRLGKWDLPKGKLEKEESFKLAAEREIEEECGIKTQVVEKICTTWHYYETDKNKILKQTKWYYLSPVSSTDLKPQKEEAIEEAIWCDINRVEDNLKNTYGTIQFVFEEFSTLAI